MRVFAVEDHSLLKGFSAGDRVRFEALDAHWMLRALPAHLPVSVEIPYAKPMAPLERAKRALSATREVLARCETG